MATNEARIVISADDKTKGAFDSARRNMGGLADQAKGIGSSISGLGFNFAALGGAIAGAFSVSAVKGAIDTLDQLDDLAEKSGIAAESLSALRYAGEVVGTPLESLATGVRKLSLNMAAAAGGGKEQIAAFQAIGVSFKNLDGSLRGSDAMLGSIADKFASFRDGPEKAALAVELFGKAGADMIPLLNKGAAGIEELKNEAASLGVVFSGDLAASAAEFNDNLKKAQLGAEGFAATVAGELLPTLNELAKIMLESKDGSNGFAESIGAGLKTALETVVILGNDVAFVLKGIGREIGAIAAQAVALATLDINGFNAISVAVKADGVQARKELDALQARILGAGQPAYVDPRILGTVGSIKQQAEALKGVAPVVTKAGAAAKSAADEFQKLWDKIQGKASGTDADFAKNIDLLAGALGKGKITFDEYTQAVHQYIAQQPFAVEAAKAATKAAEDQAKAAEELARIMGDYAKASEAGVAASVAAATQAEAELAQYGLLKSQVQQLTLAHLEQSRELAALAGEDVANIEKRIDAQKRLIAATQGIEAKDIARESAKDAASEWQKASDQINQSLSDALMDGFNAGKGFGKSFVDSVTSMFKTMVLRPTISAIVTGATGSLGLSGTANAGIAGGLGGLGNVASLFGAGGLGGSMMAGAGWLTGATTLGGSLAAGGSLLGTGTLAGGMAGAGMIAGALAPIALGISAIYSLAKSLDHSGTPHTGGGTQYSAAGGLLDARSSTFASGFTGIDYSDSTTQMTAGITQAIVGILDSTASAFGKTAGYTAAASFADDSSKDGAWGSLRIADAVGNALADWQAGGVSFRTFSDGSAGSAEYLAAISADVRTALDGIDLPDWAQAMLAKLGDAPSLEQLAGVVGQITEVQNAIVNQRAGLQQQLDLLTGVTTQRDLERAAIDESNRALFDQITALQDAASASGSAADAARDAAEAERALVTARSGLAQGIAEIAASVAGMRERTVAAAAGVDESRAAILGAYNEAQNKVNSAQATLNNLLEQSADATRRFADSLAVFLGTINPATSSNASLTSLKAQLSSTAVLASGGDAASQAALLDQARAVLKAAEAGSGTRVELARTEAFVRSLVQGVQASLPEVAPAPTIADQIGPATAALAAAQEEQARYAALAFETGTNILASTDAVGDAITALKDSYTQAAAEQAAADLALNVALTALGTLGLNEALLAALTTPLTLGGAAPSDFATALGVSQDAITALQQAMRWTDADMQMLSDALNVNVSPIVYDALGQALGVPPDLVDRLATGLGVSAVQLLELNNALGLSADTALWMSTALGVDPATRQAWATGLGVDPTSLTPLATALGWNREDALALEQAIGISGAANAIIQALPSAIGLSASAAGAIGALPSSMGFSGDALTTATALATGTGFSDDALATVSTLPTVTGFSADALTTVDRLGTVTGFSGDALATTAALATATGFSAAALATAEALADGAGFSGDALMTATSLGTATGFSTAALSTVDALASATGFSQDALQTVADMAAAVGLQPGLITALSTAMGLSDEARQALGIGVSTGAPKSSSMFDLLAVQQAQIVAQNVPMPTVAESTATTALLTQLIAANAEMKTQLAAISAASKKTADTLQTVTRGGVAMMTQAFV